MEKLAVTIKEACEMVGLGKSTAYLLIARGEWPVFRVGRAVRIRLDDLKAWVAKQANG